MSEQKTKWLKIARNDVSTAFDFLKEGNYDKCMAWLNIAEGDIRRAVEW